MTVTLITGANKGIGFETARQLIELGHVVYIGARDTERGEKAAAELGAHFTHLDVTDDASVARAVATIASSEGQLDVLIHNAGILEAVNDGPSALKSFDTNAVGIVRVTEAALPLLRKSANAVVVTVSSSMGSFWAAAGRWRKAHGPSFDWRQSDQTDPPAPSRTTMAYWPGSASLALELDAWSGCRPASRIVGGSGWRNGDGVPGRRGLLSEDPGHLP